MSTLQRYGSLLIKLSTDFYCPIYIKYHPDIHLFVFGIETDMLHMDVKKYPEWQEVLETNSIGVGITSNETFELEFKTNEIFDAPVEAVDNE